LIIYIYKKEEIWVKLDGNDFHLGFIRTKYLDLIKQNTTEIKSWHITGGYELPTASVLIAGTPTPAEGKTMRANFGLNICINFN